MMGGSNSTAKTVIESCSENPVGNRVVSDNCVTFCGVARSSQRLSILITSNHDFTFSSINTNLSYERSATNMKPTTSMRIRASRFLTDRYAYRERPDYLIELVAFGLIIITAILSLANTL
jgi:hypothetical protein